MRKLVFADEAAELEHYRNRDLKRRARLEVVRAVRYGKLVRPDRCSRCFSMGTPYAHHPNGYDNPLDIVWLCQTCHIAAHHPNSLAARQAVPWEERPHHTDPKIWKRVLASERELRRRAALR